MSGTDSNSFIPTQRPWNQRRQPSHSTEKFAPGPTKLPERTMQYSMHWTPSAKPYGLFNQPLDAIGCVRSVTVTTSTTLPERKRIFVEFKRGKFTVGRVECGRTIVEEEEDEEDEEEEDGGGGGLASDDSPPSPSFPPGGGVVVLLFPSMFPSIFPPPFHSCEW